MSLHPSLVLALALSSPAAQAAGWGDDDFGLGYLFPYYTPDQTLSVAFGDQEPDVCGGAGRVRFTAMARSPSLDVVLLLDYSGSISKSEWDNEVIPAAAELVGAFGPLISPTAPASGSNVRFAVARFSTGAMLEHGFADTQSYSAVVQALTDLYTNPVLESDRPAGYTDLTAGLDLALTQFDSHGSPERPKVVVVLTDGVPRTASGTQNVCDAEPAALDARGVEVRIVGVGSDFQAGPVTCLVDEADEIVPVSSFSAVEWTEVIREFPGVSDLQLTLELDGAVDWGAPTATSGTVVRTGSRVEWTAGNLNTGSGAIVGEPNVGIALDIPFVQPSDSPGGAAPLFTAGEVRHRAYGATSETTGLLDLTQMPTTLPACTADPVDRDGDGVPDDQDAFPDDPSESADADGDGVGDGADTCPGGDDRADADADGAPDGCDQCPVDPYNDTDGDGSCDSADPCPFDAADDADVDGACGDVDLCPLDPDDDLDADGVCGDVDTCPEDPANDADGDGICGNVDACAGGDDAVDTDGDGVADACDRCPGDAANDADGDGVCGDEDPCPLDALDDIDGDGRCADEDACPLDAPDDTDGDALCDSVDPCPVDWANDADGDGFCEGDDACPTVADPDQADRDGDGVGDACEPDGDGDGVADDADGCPLVADPGQLDADGDGIGDACDTDADGDGVTDGVDSCPGTPVGEPVLSSGCSIEQHAPCGAAWKNHGAYVSAVSRAADTLARAGTITWSERDAIVSGAARSTCGR